MFSLSVEVDHDLSLVHHYQPNNLTYRSMLDSDIHHSREIQVLKLLCKQYLITLNARLSYVTDYKVHTKVHTKPGTARRRVAKLVSTDKKKKQ